jgi:hypothetical protein
LQKKLLNRPKKKKKKNPDGTAMGAMASGIY